MIHEPLRTAEFKKQVDEARGRAGREHTTLWTSDLDGEFWRMFPNDDVPPEVKVRISKYGVNSVHWGRLHVRDVKGFTEVGRIGNEPAHHLAMTIKDAVEGMGGQLKGSGASTAFHLWREKFNAGKPWRNVNITTDDLDWYREAYFGGRTQCYLNGVIHRAGHRPGRLIRRMNAPSYELEPGKTLVRIDMNSAFPAVARRPMPYVWAKYSDELDLTIRCGIATVTIRTGEGVRILPERNRSQEGVTIGYPLPGSTIRGTWTYPMIREALKNGGKIVEVHRARSFCMEYFPLRRFMDSVYQTQSGMDKGPAQKAIKEFGRRLYGKFGSSRWTLDLKPFAESFNPYIDEDGILKMPELPTAMVGGRCFIAEKMPEYPVSSNPVWSAFISDRVSISLARVQMLLNEAGCNVFYVDTDSALFACPTKEGKPVLPDSIRERIGDELGQWKIDWTGDHVTLMGSKSYILQGEAPKMSGIPKVIAPDLVRHGRAEYTQNRTLLNKPRTIKFKMCAGRITSE